MMHARLIHAELLNDLLLEQAAVQPALAEMVPVMVSCLGYAAGGVWGYPPQVTKGQ